MAGEVWIWLVCVGGLGMAGEGGRVGNGWCGGRVGSGWCRGEGWVWLVCVGGLGYVGAVGCCFAGGKVDILLAGMCEYQGIGEP